MTKKELSPNQKRKLDNNQAITKAMHTYIEKNGKMPSMVEISASTGISRQTISKHLDDLSLSNNIKKYRLMSDQVMDSMIKACDQGNAQAMKLYYQLVWGWKLSNLSEKDSKYFNNQVIYEIISESSQSNKQEVEKQKNEQPDALKNWQKEMREYENDFRKNDVG